MSEGSSLPEVLIGFMEAIAPIRDAASGYRRSLVAEGFTEDAASSMASDLHHALIAAMTKGMNG